MEISALFSLITVNFLFIISATDIKNGETFFHIDVLNEGDVLHSEDDCTCSDSIRNFLTKHPMSFTITPVKVIHSRIIFISNESKRSN